MQGRLGVGMEEAVTIPRTRIVPFEYPTPLSDRSLCRAAPRQPPRCRGCVRRRLAPSRGRGSGPGPPLRAAAQPPRAGPPRARRPELRPHGREPRWAGAGLSPGGLSAVLRAAPGPSPPRSLPAPAGERPQPALPAGSRRAAREQRGRGRAGLPGPAERVPRRCPRCPHGGDCSEGQPGEAAGSRRPPPSGGFALARAGRWL